MTELRDNIFAIEVPEDAKDFGCVHIFHGEDVLYYPDSDGQTVPVANAPCHCDQVEILFTTKGVNEEQAASIVEKGQIYKVWYRNYEHRGFKEIAHFKTALPSLQSLLKSKGLTAGNYLIIKKVEG